MDGGIRYGSMIGKALKAALTRLGGHKPDGLAPRSGPSARGKQIEIDRKIIHYAGGIWDK